MHFLQGEKESTPLLAKHAHTIDIYCVGHLAQGIQVGMLLPRAHTEFTSFVQSATAPTSERHRRPVSGRLALPEPTAPVASSPHLRQLMTLASSSTPKGSVLPPGGALQISQESV